MTRHYFGTDGIRGTANTEPMTAAIALKVGMAAGAHFMNGDHRHKVVIAKDTRLSGYMIEPALTAGFISTGMDVVLVGPMPTPAVAMLTRAMRADLGVMISASHNPYHDNGIKLFGPDGYKLSDDVEREIEALMDAEKPSLAAPSKLGRAKRLDDAPGRYIEFVKNTFPKQLRLDGLKIVVDCANGAAYHLAPLILWELGAEVVSIGVAPDGFNINKDCGSTHPEQLCREVRRHGAQLGIALDGDADRVVLCDERGELIGGDQVLAMIATYWQKAGLLKGNCVIGTEMCNLGLERYLGSLGVNLHRTSVGDRYVMEAMREQACNVGGEPSGHMILSDYSTTGDGMVSALQVLALLIASAKPMSELSRLFAPLPQILQNVHYAPGTAPLDSPAAEQAIAKARKALGAKGRVLVRKSGTEPVIRVMAEGEDETQVRQAVNIIVNALDDSLCLVPCA